jgi:hypothetical protein
VALVVLLQTSRVSAEATVARLRALDIDAQVIDRPNVLLKLSSGGNYRVRVVVPEQELARAREELSRWESEARTRVQALARDVQLGLALGSLPAALLALGLLLRPPAEPCWWWLVLPAWGTGLLGWALWSRLHGPLA